MHTSKLILTLLAVAVAAGPVGCKQDQTKVDLPSKSVGADKKAGPQKPADSPASTAETDAPVPAGSEGQPGALTTTASADGRRFSGSFEAQRTTDVAATVGGIVRKVYVDEGDVVDKGDRLINIDGQDYQLRVDQARAGIDAAQAQVDTLKTEYDRTVKLRNKQAVSASQLDQLTGQLAGARAQLQKAKVGLRMAKKARGDALIRAPYAGVITGVEVAEGDFAAPGPRALMTLAEVQKLYLRVHIPEQYANDVARGDSLAVTVPALDDQTLNLPITRINPSISGRSRAFDVLAGLDNADLHIRPGMYAQVSLADTTAQPTLDDAAPTDEQANVDHRGDQ